MKIFENKNNNPGIRPRRNKNTAIVPSLNIQKEHAKYKINLSTKKKKNKGSPEPNDVNL